MKNLFHELTHNLSFIKATGIGTFTMGIFLFGGGPTVTLVEYVVRFFASIITGFGVGFVTVLAKYYADKFINRKKDDDRTDKKDKADNKVA